MIVLYYVILYLQQRLNLDDTDRYNNLQHSADGCSESSTNLAPPLNKGSYMLYFQ
jgi:hypothetical protein